MTVFETFPFDIFFETSKYLDLDDVAHLAQTCRQLRAQLLQNALSRRIVETHHHYTNEACTARQGTISYNESLCMIYDRRHALSTTQPFSARVVGQGSTFLYRQGVLCLQTGSSVQISNLRSSCSVVTLDLMTMVFGGNTCESAGVSFEMMYYSDELLSVLVNIESNESWIYCVKTTSSLQDDNRVVRSVGLGHDHSKLFIRHTSQYLYYGSHTGTSPNDGHRKWEIRGVALQPGFELSAEQGRPLLLEDFHGSDVGSTVTFEIHDGFFYAVSNQGTYEVEEIDWTSFYNCIRFPLNDPVALAVENDARIYRRQHAEGAIHDSWTDLTLQPDEKTNKLFVVESRREWVGASSKQLRTFYTTCIDFSASELAADESPRDDESDPPQLPEDDLLTTLLDSSHGASYMPTPRQYSWSRHPEFSTIDISPRSFILARTKFRTYNYSCSAFMDLVEDETCCRGGTDTSPSCLRLRIGSRRVAPALSTTDDFASDSIWRNNQSKMPRFADSTKYRYTPTRMWPPPRSTCPCSARLHRIMNPPSTPGCTAGQTSITAACDERSIVYMIRPRYASSYQHSTHTLGTVVCIDFGREALLTPSAAHPDDMRWDWSPGQDGRCRSGTCW
ncbi:uncharacterized protein EKO05_0007756 [Ascochyta rabiei]|uniref:uncharacterized protein n=1 Tax=Didymella rabiei TaxID=5454 RepID=UPI0021FCCDEB|nr:uncharacterized protein EKO05_0007756 [Ascochyta rabiei]UPX17397.1 hypothetical protein EKO05_0007756 [Ascochyta rabiei]